MQIIKCDLPKEAQNIEPITRVKLVNDPGSKKGRPVPFEKLRFAETAVEIKRPVKG